jgi:hypothetical protein
MMTDEDKFKESVEKLVDSAQLHGFTLGVICMISGYLFNLFIHWLLG